MGGVCACGGGDSSSDDTAMPTPGSVSTVPPTVTTTTLATTTSVPATTVAPTSTLPPTTQLEATGGDVRACRTMQDAVETFAIGEIGRDVEGSRIWVNKKGTRISVAPVDYGILSSGLDDESVTALESADDERLADLVLDVSNSLQESLSAEDDDYGQSVYDVVVTVDDLSRSLEKRCTALGVTSDFYHPLNMQGGGGSKDT